MEVSLDHYGIHWFRRDLRVAGNPALQWSLKEHKGRVVGIFCFDSKFLGRPDFSHNRFAVFLETLAQLKSELRELGSELLVVDELPAVFFQSLDARFVKKPATVTWCRDYEPFSVNRDQQVEQILGEASVHSRTFEDHVLISPTKVVKSDGTPFQVYSPFGRRWFDELNLAATQQLIKRQQTGLDYLERRARGLDIEPCFTLTWAEIKKTSWNPADALDEFRQANKKSASVSPPPAGSLAAYKALVDFAPKLEAYKAGRDYPATLATSRLSIYLKNGSITLAQIIAYLKISELKFKASGGPTHFLKELAWREFYYSILHHFPHVEHEAFNPRYNDLAWENNSDWWQRWCEGLTGFPIVDAGMRELRQTGFMHNRSRMIVASFLTKDLLIDWRWGEKFFMQHLIDGDLAPNNGGWQWAASTGCDPQPYFRIFNPWLQARKFDPEAAYIKQFVPELRELSASQIHSEDANARVLCGYPKPIVEHNVQRDKALKLYKITSPPQ